jgi:hypothetical protein
MELYIDASASKGFGAYYTGKWFSSAWSEDFLCKIVRSSVILLLPLYNSKNAVDNVLSLTKGKSSDHADENHLPV